MDTLTIDVYRDDLLDRGVLHLLSFYIFFLVPVLNKIIGRIHDHLPLYIHTNIYIYKA
jgi:hypothetical protein